MSLRKDIEEAYIKALGVDPENKGNIPELAEDLTNAIVDFLQKQPFTITKMESVLRLEELKTTGTLKADVLDKVEHSKALNIIKQRFNERTELGKELALYNIIINKILSSYSSKIR